MNQLFRFQCWSIIASLCFLVGCGSNGVTTHPILGQLEFADGTKPNFGTVEFYNREHKLNARGKIAEDGTFTVGTYEPGDGAVTGTHSVVIIQLTSNHLAAKKEIIVKVDENASGIDHDHDHDGEHEAELRLHRKYFDYRTSGLNIEVKPGQNQIKFVLDQQPSGR